MKIFTIGVYGKAADEFLDELAKNKIDVLVDIRLRRGMRGHEYSWANNARLQTVLKQNKIGYLHALEYAPTSDLLKLQHDYDKRMGWPVRDREHLSPEYIKAYKKILKKHKPEDLIKQIEEQFPKAKRIALFCVEQDAKVCHRGILAGEMETKT